MTDRYDPNLILDYVEGDLDEGRRHGFERLLAEDPTLRALVDELRADRAAVRALPVDEPAVSLSEAATGSMERQLLLGETPIPVGSGKAYAGGGRTAGSVPWVRLGSYAAVAAMLAVVGVIVLQPMRGTPLPEQAQSLYAKGETDAMAARDTVLAHDGSGLAALRGAGEGGAARQTDGLATAATPAPVVVADEVAGAFMDTLASGGGGSVSAGSSGEAPRGLAEADVAEAGRTVLGVPVVVPMDRMFADPASANALVLQTVSDSDRDALQAGFTRVAPSEMRLAVVSRSPATTRRQIEWWARNNGAMVLGGDDAAAGFKAVATAATPDPESGRATEEPATLRLVLNRGQVAQLAAVLNRQPVQQRAVVEPVAVPDGAADEGEAMAYRTGRVPQAEGSERPAVSLHPLGDAAEGPARRPAERKRELVPGRELSTLGEAVEGGLDAWGGMPAASEPAALSEWSNAGRTEANAPASVTEATAQIAGVDPLAAAPRLRYHTAEAAPPAPRAEVVPFFQTQAFPFAKDAATTSNVMAVQPDYAAWVWPLLNDQRISLPVIIAPADPVEAAVPGAGQDLQPSSPQP